MKMLPIVGCVLLALLGCKPDAALKHAEVMDKGTENQRQAPPPPPNIIASPTVPIDQTTLGNITGVVHFNGAAPAPVRIDTSMDPACGLASHGDVYSEQFMVNSGKLGNVFVYVKDGPASAMSMGTSMSGPVVLDQRGCQYVPHVVAVQVGGYVEFRNSDATMHNIHTMPTVVGNTTVDVSQSPRGRPVDKQFQQPELMIPVRCNNHPWMNAYINVSATPFFAITDKNGRFDLSGLPAGNYTLGAVHEKLGEQTMQVTVNPKSMTKADFAFSK